MANGARVFLAICLATLLSSCGLKIPDPGIYAVGCPNGPVAQSGDQDQLFFVSTAMPDCRKGSLTLTGFRYAPPTFGSGLYTWSGPEAELQPALVQNDEAQWWDAVEDQAAGAGDGGRVLVFVHGFNNTFDEALKTTAQIAQLQANGVPVVAIHWPSRAAATRYTFDEASIAWAQDPIENLLANLSKRVGDITIVVHSMGTRAAIRAVIALERIEGARPDSVKRLVLASADIDRDLFLREKGSAYQILKRSRTILAYASNRDVPIAISRNLHGYSRLGSTDCRYDVSFSRREKGEDGKCHLSKYGSDRLIVVSTDRVDAKGRLEHRDFLKDCRTRAHFSAFLQGKPTRPFEEQLTDPEGLVGYEIDPDAPDEQGLCLSGD